MLHQIFFCLSDHKKKATDNGTQAILINHSVADENIIIT